MYVCIYIVYIYTKTNIDDSLINTTQLIVKATNLHIRPPLRPVVSLKGIQNIFLDMLIPFSNLYCIIHIVS